MTSNEIAFVEDGHPVTVAEARKADYVTSHYTLVTCAVCKTYCEGVPFYYNEDGEVICYDCIEVDGDTEEDEDLKAFDDGVAAAHAEHGPHIIFVPKGD